MPIIYFCFAESEDALQQLLNEFQSYCVRWKLNVNPEKSKTVIFGHRSCPPYFFSFNKQPIEVVNNSKYFRVLLPKTRAGRGSSSGCGRRFDPHIRQHSFVEICSWKHSYGHSLPSTNSRRAVVSYWWKNVHNVLVNCLGGLPRNSVDRLTNRARNDLKKSKSRKTPTQQQQPKSRSFSQTNENIL